MPNFVQTVRLNKLPVTGIVPESSGTAPAAPVDGQLWIDTSVTPKLLRVWDGTTWAPANMYFGTTAGSVAEGNDARIVGAQQTSQKNQANGYAGLDGSTKLTYAHLPVAADGASTASTVVAANDSRLSNQRVPTDASVTGGPAGAGVKIAAGTITHDNVATANKDGVAGTASMRTLGTGAQQAMAGNTRLDTIAAPTGSVSLNNQKITGLGAPTAASDAARLADVQAAAAGIDAKPSVRVATTANHALTGLTAIDGITPVANDRILVKNQTTASANGVYLAASGAWTRDTDTITPNSAWFVEQGSTQGDTAWWVTNDGTITVGTTALVISQYAGPNSHTGTTNRITVAGTVIDIAATYVGQTSITTLGTVATGTWSATTIALNKGGTGATTAPAARANLGASQVGYAADLGAVTAGVPLVVTHNLGTQDVIAQVRDTSTNEYVGLDIINASTNTVTVTAGQTFTAGALRIVVLPVS